MKDEPMSNSQWLGDLCNKGFLKKLHNIKDFETYRIFNTDILFELRVKGKHKIEITRFSQTKIIELDDVLNIIKDDKLKELLIFELDRF